MRANLVTSLLGFGCAVYCAAVCASPDLLRERVPDRRPTLLVLGTAHFQNPGRDLVNPNVDDVLSETRQAQIAATVQELVRFRPTRVALEWLISDQAHLDNIYKNYVAGSVSLGASEKEQLGLRLAKLVGLSHVDAVDWNGMPPGPADLYNWDKYGNSRGQRDLVRSILDAGKLSAYNVPLDKSKNLTTWLLQMNSDAVLAAGHRFYFDISMVGDTSRQPGANYVSQWYGRNLRIFANIARVADNPSDRIVVIYGFGHAYLLRQFARESGAFRVVDVADVLHQ